MRDRERYRDRVGGEGWGEEIEHKLNGEANRNK